MNGSIKVAVVGHGNVGRGVVDAVQSSADMTLVGIVEPDRSQGPAGFPRGVPVVDDIGRLGVMDVAIMCLRSRTVYDHARSILERGISTVDCFDMHGAELLDM
ncbi:MAG: Gfo/Idh/MocA family oxidoreductase, partial [Bacillota bacterium]